MTFEEATESRVSLERARHEIIAHHAQADIVDYQLFAWEGDSTFENGINCIRFARAADGTVSGRDVLNWLGY